MHNTLKKTFCLILVAISLLACMAPVSAAAKPKATANTKATLAYTLKGLPVGRAVQNFYVGSSYVYVTQRVDSTTYLSRLKINGKVANYTDHMTLRNCGHGESLDLYSHNGQNYFYIGCKADPSGDNDHDLSLQIARIKYQAGASYDYTELNRFINLDWANKNGTDMGSVYRAAVAVRGETTIFRIELKSSRDVVYSAYKTTDINKLLDKSQSVSMKSAGVKSALLFSFRQKRSEKVCANSGFQGLEISAKSRIYLSGGAKGETPAIARMNSTGDYLKLVKITNVGKLEIEGLQWKDDKLYFNIVTGDTSAARKNEQIIYYIKESVF